MNGRHWCQHSPRFSQCSVVVKRMLSTNANRCLLFAFSFFWYTERIISIMAPSPNPTSITTGQKVGAAFMFVFALLAVGLGMIQMRTTIYGPFVQANASDAGADEAQLLFDESIKLQRIDTDQDGINDFEELNFYQTSPYLPDTDSDGISDKKEITDGTDPLCPEGKDCGIGVEASFSTDQTDTGDIESKVFEQAVSGTNAIFGGGAGADLGALLQDPAQIRAALLASGQLTADQLANITDDQLLDLAQEAVKQQAATSGSSSVTTPSTTPTPSASGSAVTTADLEALLEKPDELRQLLLSTGKMTKEQLSQIDDATLITVTKQIIADNS